MHQVRRVAMLSLHTSPLAQPGGGDAGGMNVYVRSLALELGAAGVEVEIFTRAVSPHQPETVDLGPGARVRHIAAGPAGPVPKEALPALVPELAQKIRAVIEAMPAGRFEVLHSHYWISGIAGLELAAATSMPLVHTMHTMAKVKNHHRGGHAAEPARRSEGEQRIVHGASRLIANTTAEAAELERHYGGCERRIDVVAPGVDLRIFTPAFRDRSRQQCGIAPWIYHVVFAGRLQKLKGPHVLIRAAALLAERRPDLPLHLTIIGSPSGPEKYDVPTMVAASGLADRVTVLPPMAAESLAHWYRSADVVAMPSSSESFGLVALEAQACGTPVVATNVGGLPRAVSEGRTGLLVEGRETAGWAAALESLYDFPQTRADMGRAASIYAGGFGWQHTAELTVASYDRALG